MKIFKKLLKKIAKINYFSIFSKDVTNQPFASLDEKRKIFGKFEKILKDFDENSIENVNFYFIFILENLLVKIEPSEITPFFYNNCFSVSGGCPPIPPGYALETK